MPVRVGPGCRRTATGGNLRLMSRHVAIVTDSTAYLPHPAMARHGITSVPLTVVLGDEALEEGTEISARSLAVALQKRRSVTTSRPSPEMFVRAYRAAADAGAAGIVSLHLSAEFSGTYDAAVVAAKTASVPVRVVDTGMVAMALGFCALAAAEAAEAAWFRRRGRGRRREARRRHVRVLLRRHPRLPPPRRPDRRRAGPARLGPRGEAAADAGRRADRDAGEGAHGLEGHRPPGGTRRRAGGHGQRGRRRAPPRRPRSGPRSWRSGCASASPAWSSCTSARSAR